MKLAIISEKTRYHFQKPLRNFRQTEVFHLYKKTFSDSRLRDKNLFRYKNVFELYRALKTIKPDLIQGLEPYYGYSRFKIPLRVLPIILVTLFYCRVTKTPYFFHCLENIAPEQKFGPLAGKIMKTMAKVYARGALFIYYLNFDARKNLLDLGINSEKISWGLWGVWGVDTNEFKPIKKPEKQLIFIGTLSEQKGILPLVRAIAIARAKIADLKLEIIGSGPLEAKTKNLIAELKLTDIIKMRGEIPSGKIASHLANSYALIAPSRQLKYSAEQVGLVLIEAQSCAVPVISTKTGSIAEFVKAGRTALLLDEGSPSNLATAIIKLWKNKKLHHRLAEAGRKEALENYDAKKNSQKLEREIIERYKKFAGR